MRSSFLAARTAEQVLEPGTLARFAPGLDWPTIKTLDRGRGAAWWRCAIADSEERGLIEWDREAAVWRLSDAGRAWVKDVS